MLSAAFAPFPRWLTPLAACLNVRPINLGGEDGGAFGGPASLGALDILASIPYFVIGATGAALAWAEDQFSRLGFVERMRTRRGYRTVSVDDDGKRQLGPLRSSVGSC
jgi:hypothetical protein